MVFLDYFLTFFHSAFILFVLTGWIWVKTRKAHILAIGLVLMAWGVLGFWLGTWGYCPLTDWHWDIKRSLGERGMPSSFVEYIVEKIFKADFPKKLVDLCTLAGLVFGIVMANLKATIRRNPL